MRHPAYANESVPLAFAAEVITQPVSRTLFPTKKLLEALIEAWVCDKCGFSERYASDLEVLRKMVDQGARTVRVVDESTPSGGAFR